MHLPTHANLQAALKLEKMKEKVILKNEKEKTKEFNKDELKVN